MAMTTRTYKVLTCDFCDAEGEGVENRRIELDGKRRQLEACESCWPVASVEELLDAGRQIRRMPKQKKG
jgi:hypothetical protein